MGWDSQRPISLQALAATRAGEGNVSGSSTAFSVLGLWPRLERFLKKPWLGKVRSAGLYVRNVFPAMPILIRLPIGCWWLAWNNHLGHHLLSRGFEEPEYAFV